LRSTAHTTTMNGCTQPTTNSAKIFWNFWRSKNAILFLKLNNHQVSSSFKLRCHFFFFSFPVLFTIPQEVVEGGVSCQGVLFVRGFHELFPVNALLKVVRGWVESFLGLRIKSSMKVDFFLHFDQTYFHYFFDLGINLLCISDKNWIKKILKNTSNNVIRATVFFSGTKAPFSNFFTLFNCVLFHFLRCCRLHLCTSHFFLRIIFFSSIFHLEIIIFYVHSHIFIRREVGWMPGLGPVRTLQDQSPVCNFYTLSVKGGSKSLIEKIRTRSWGWEIGIRN